MLGGEKIKVNTTNEILKRTHTPPPREWKGPTLYDLIKVGFFAFGFPKNGFVSVDTTNRCNLRCRHCYFFEQDYEEKPELSLDEWFAKFEALKKAEPWRFPFFQCTWVGGEPLLRKELIERGRRYFMYNTVVTNGTMPLPNWPDVNWYVSIDGLEEHHEYIRKAKGIYKKIKRNIMNMNAERGVTIACCLTKQNCGDVEDLVIEWSQVPGVKHMVFDFYTPIESIDDDLWPGWEMRDRTIDVLLEMKKLYGDFLVTPARTFRMMKSENAAAVTENCLFEKKATSFAPNGEAKPKCMLGEKSDCTRCGCVVPYYMASLTDRSFILGDHLAGVRNFFATVGARATSLTHAI